MINIVLSAKARDAVRKLVRDHAGYDDFCATYGLANSRDMDKRMLMNAVEVFGLEQQARDIAARHTGTEAPDEPNAFVSGPLTPSRIVHAVMAVGEGADAMRDSVLSPLRPFLNSVTLGQVESALAPIIDAAMKPAVEVEKVITLDANGNAVIPAVPPVADAKRTGKAKLGTLFGFRHSKFGAYEVDMWDSAKAPKVDRFYVPQPEMVFNVATALETGHFVWFAGPAGTGKTTLPTQVAARTGRPFLRCAMDRAVEPIDLFGTTGLKNGATVWEDGKITRAIRQPGCIILIDEITMTPPGIAATLQTLLDERYLELPTGERVDCAPGVWFCCADNTFGYGDDTGMYHGTSQANSALVDRFARMVKVDYLPLNLESEALFNRSSAPRPACDMIVTFVSGARKLPGFDARPLSIRRMVAFMGMAVAGFDVSRCFEDTFLTRLPDAERESLRAHIKANFNAVDFVRAMTGAKAPAQGPVPGPEQASAKNAFTPIDTME